MKIITDKISIGELKKMAQRMFGSFIKGVVDIEKGIMIIDGELHSDEEALLLEKGSKQENLWGINIYPELPEEERIEFDSIINLKPSQGNRSRNIEDEKIRERITQIVTGFITE